MARLRASVIIQVNAWPRPRQNLLPGARSARKPPVKHLLPLRGYSIYAAGGQTRLGGTDRKERLMPRRRARRWREEAQRQKNLLDSVARRWPKVLQSIYEACLAVRLRVWRKSSFQLAYQSRHDMRVPANFSWLIRRTES